MGGVIVFAYSAFGSPLRDEIRSSAAGLEAVADAIEGAAGAIEARRLLLSQMAEILKATAVQIGQLERLVSDQTKARPNTPRASSRPARRSSILQVLSTRSPWP